MKKYLPLIIVWIVFILLGFVVYFALVARGAEATCNLVCPQGYSHVSQSHHGYCYKGNNPDWPEDYKAKVCEVLPTVTPMPSVTPTVTPTPEVTDVPDEVTPTPEPEVIVEPTKAPKKGFEMGGSPVCNDEKPKYAPTVTYAMRDGKGNAEVKWTTTDTKEFILYYGPTGKDLIWTTGRIMGEETTLHFINEMIDVQACSVSQCGQLNCGARFIDP